MSKPDDLQGALTALKDSLIKKEGEYQEPDDLIPVRGAILKDGKVRLTNPDAEWLKAWRGAAPTGHPLYAPTVSMARWVVAMFELGALRAKYNNEIINAVLLGRDPKLEETSWISPENPGWKLEIPEKATESERDKLLREHAGQGVGLGRPVDTRC